MTTKTVGIRELKAKLSSFLALVRKGQTILVTDRGRVVAEIREPAPKPLDPFELALDDLVQRGVVRLGKKLSPAQRKRLYRPTGIHLPSSVIRKALDEGRDETRR